MEVADFFETSVTTQIILPYYNLDDYNINIHTWQNFETLYKICMFTTSTSHPADHTVQRRSVEQVRGTINWNFNPKTAEILLVTFRC
jgi:hypothetical protein